MAAREDEVLLSPMTNAIAPKLRCSNCGFEPEDPANPPKFCPNCGNAFGPEDIVS